VNRLDSRPAAIERVEEDSNRSLNRGFDQVVDARLSRRRLLQAAMTTAAASAFGGLALGGCSVPFEAPGTATGDVDPSMLGFEPVAKSLADAVSVPPGYTARVLIAVGDPLFAGVGAYRNDGTDSDFTGRCGEWHDGMEYFGLAPDGSRDDDASDRALLAINHEWISPAFLHANGATGTPRPASEVDTETAAMGVTVVEIAKDAAGHFRYVQASGFNRRITTLSEVVLSGPARGHRLLVTRFSPDGTRTRGTINNCGTGKTPWGTLLTGEENWTYFFARNPGDDALRSDAENIALRRYGRPPGTRQAYGWNTVRSADDRYARWNTSVTGSSADGRDDYRHEINGQGWITEIDPYEPDSVVRKRTALGRMAHEGAAFSIPAPGQPLAVYMGDDSRNEYMYKFVSEALWDPADARAADRLAIGDKYLDRGTLYAARFDDDGNGQWLPLHPENAAVRGSTSYAFGDLGDVLIHARLAADAAGATPMDRPEWTTVNPANGEVYLTLTNNSNRIRARVDAANPRLRNLNGHIVRMKEDYPGSSDFRWDIYLFGAESDADATRINLSGLTVDQAFSSPDGISFTNSTGLLWIQTDDEAMTHKCNCMMLAAVPGEVGDGDRLTLRYGTRSVTTHIGARPSQSTLKRFLVGPVDQEITGLAETPDGRVLFVNIQHPGSGTPAVTAGDPSQYTSHWPGNAGYGAGGANARPRSATVMIVKDDGGTIGR
jgi:uncharacterized protein